MREIKFRAYFKNKVYDVVELDLKDKNVVLVSIEKDKSAQKIGHYKSLDEVKIVQYTGVKDENNIEIYEGDIVKESIDNELGFIDFDEGSFIAKFKREGNLYLDCLLSNLYFDTEVIGNIYENPELIN